MNSMHRTPGMEVMEQIADQARNARPVHHFKLIDVSEIEDRGMQAVATLAASLDWNVLIKKNSVATLIARDGFKQAIPTDTSVRFNVFVNRVYATFTHTVTAIPTHELIEAIIKRHKLDPSHARVFRDALGGKPEEPLPEEEPVEAVEAEHVEPTLAVGPNGAQYVSHVMETVTRENQVTYRCKICGAEYPTKRGVGGHYGKHVQLGEAQPTDKLPKEYVNERDPDYVPTLQYAKRKPPPPEPEPEVSEAVVEYVRATETPEPSPRAFPLDMIGALLQDVIDDAVHQAVAGLQQQLDAAHAEIERLRHERVILRDLLQ